MYPSYFKVDRIRKKQTNFAKIDQIKTRSTSYHFAYLLKAALSAE
jgi:hypothetical protein